MTDKRFPVVYSVLLGFFATIMIVLMILLFAEYRFFCKQAQELLLLKEQYGHYIAMLHKKINNESCEEQADRQDHDTVSTVVHDSDSDDILEEMIEESPTMMDEIAAAESSDAPDNDDEYVDESFVVINRHPDYLKQSTLDYMESQELNALMTAIDIDRWSDYTDRKTVAPQPKKINSRKPVVSQKKEQKIGTIRRPIRDCGFIWPIEEHKFWLSSLFGPRKRIDRTWGFHHGIDMAAVKGTAVRAVRAGIVVEASFQSGYGNTVVIKHSETMKTRYAHLHTLRVYVGQKVKQGSIVGTVGETGFIRKKGKDGSHLHFEVYERGKRINPLHCLPRMT